MDAGSLQANVLVALDDVAAHGVNLDDGSALALGQHLHFVSTSLRAGALLRTTGNQSSTMPRSRRLFATTLTELNAIAALAMMGLSSHPKAGYRTPAATGMPITL